MGSASVYQTYSLHTPPQHQINSHMNIHIHQSALHCCILFFPFLISGLIPQLMNFNRPQSQHLNCVFLSPKVMALNHLRVLRRLVLVAWRKSEQQREGRIDGWMDAEDGRDVQE